jgi:hypothetical protein
MNWLAWIAAAVGFEIGIGVLAGRFVAAGDR